MVTKWLHSLQERTSTRWSAVTFVVRPGHRRIKCYVCTCFKFKGLVGIPLCNFGSRCNLHYANNLLILPTGGLEDLRIVKLLILIFECLLGLETNFSKTCLFSCKWGELPAEEAATTLNCQVGLLPITYLGIPISGRRPRRQDCERVILKVRKRLASWKGRFLSLGGRLTLVNSVLSTLSTYWMSIFRLLAWVIKKIDQIRRDCLWSGPDIDKTTCHLVYWRNLCLPCEQGGWGILDLYTFNQALLGKWWWKFMSGANWCVSKVIQFNYLMSR